MLKTILQNYFSNEYKEIDKDQLKELIVKRKDSENEFLDDFEELINLGLIQKSQKFLGRGKGSTTTYIPNDRFGRSIYQYLIIRKDDNLGLK